MEEWKDIPGYEGLYQASTLGRIRSVEGKETTTTRFGGTVRHWRSRIIRQHISGTKRKDARVKLWKDKKEHTYLVSRLIALTWVDGYKEGLTVDHINCNNLDNRAENLQWMTLEDNIKKAFDDGCYWRLKLSNRDRGVLKC